MTWVKKANLRGIPGPRGASGPAGAAGPALNLTVGNVTSVTDAQPAKVTLRGTAPNQILDFEIPRGLAGTGTATTDEATGALVGTKGTATRTALERGFMPLGISTSAMGYGAKGDGVTDDTAAVQAAINAVGAAGGGTVFLPGRHKITNVSITYPNITLAGPGEILEGSVNIGTDGTAPPYARLDTRIQDLRFIRAALSPTVNAITGARVLGVMVDNCYFKNYNSAFYVRPQAFTGTNTVHCSRMQLSRIMTADCNFVLRVPPFTSGGGLLVAADVLLTNSNELAVLDSHVYAEGVDGLIVSNNIMFHSGSNQASPTKRYNVYVDGGSYVSIDNNFLFEAGNEGVLLSRTQNFSVTNNKVAFPGQRVRSDGIRITGGDSAGQEFGEGVVSGNVVFFPSRHGINIDGPTGHVAVDGNVVRSPGTGSRFYGTGTITVADYISTASTTTDIRVTGGEYSGGVYTPRIAVRGAKSRGQVGTNVTAFVPGSSTPSRSENWSTDEYGSAYFFTNRKMSSGAQSANLTFLVDLEPGVYTLDLWHQKNVNCGIYTVIVDGVIISTVDGYAASLTPTKSAITNVAIPVGGTTELTLLMSTKNALATEYRGALSAIGVTRTGNHV